MTEWENGDLRMPEGGLVSPEARGVLDSLPQIAWVAGADMVPVFLNRRWYEYTGQAMDAPPDPNSPVHPDDFAGLIEQTVAASAAGVTFECEGRVRRHDGQYRWHLIRVAPRRNDADEIVGWLGTSTDIQDRKAAEEMLVATTDSLPAFIAFIDSDLVYRFCNEAFETWFGRPRTAIVGTPMREIVGDAAFEGILPHLQRALTGERTGYEQWLEFGNGERRFMRATYIPSILPDGKVSGVFAMISDDTNTELAKEELRTRERTLSFLAELGEATRLLWDPDETVALTAMMLGKHLKVSRCVYCDIEEDQETVTNLHNWSPSAPSIAGVDMTLSQFGPFVSEPLRNGRTLVAKDVSKEASPEEAAALMAIQVYAQIACPLKKDGRLVAVMAIHSDVPRVWTQHEIELVELVIERCWTEIGRARAERGLRQSEARLRRVLEAATVGVIFNDRQGRFTYCNPPLLAMLGYTQQELIAGKLSWSLVQAPDRLAEDNLALEQLRISGSCDPYETELVAKDGQRVPVYVGAAFIPDESGGGLMGAAFVTDLTALKAAQRELEAMNRGLDARVRERTAELITANQALETYSHHVAHDLRAPLRAIVSTSRMIEEDFGPTLNDEIRAHLDRQVLAASRLGQLVDDLLRSSRLSREEMVRAEIDFTALAEEAGAEALSMHPASQVTVHVQKNLHAKADPRLLRLALINLIENSVKYSPLGGEVTVGYDRAFFVKDHGIGISKDYFGKIFEPFQRLHRDDEFQGTGIGLSNVRQVVERHGGRVWVESEPGIGSTFYFTLE